MNDSNLNCTTQDNPGNPFPKAEGFLGPFPFWIGRYRIEKILGKGGFGVVYLAHDEQLNRMVAVKVPHSKVIANNPNTDAYLAEARMVAGLDHMHIVPVYDVGSTQDYPCFFVSKFINGTDLASKIQKERFDFQSAARLVAPLADALHYAHKQGLVHRDVKPGNILVGLDEKPYLVDFGLALRDENLGKGPQYAGTPTYMSPEQARGEGDRVDGRSDIFSLGIVLYELLGGRPPFRSDNLAELLKLITSCEPRPLRQYNEKLPMELERICQKAMAKRLNERYLSAHDMAEDLKDFLHGKKELNAAVSRGLNPSSSTMNAILPADQKSIAVLPFVNISSDKENEYLSDGITEEILNTLAKIPGLRVPARTSSFAFKGKNVDMRKIGEMLNVRTILEGSVRKSGDRLRINAQLINTVDGFRLWSETYDRGMTNIFDIQDEIARVIVNKLKITLGEETKFASARHNTENVESYEMYLKGRFHAEHLTEFQLNLAITHFQAALDRQPDYALAYSGMAQVYFMLNFFALVHPEKVIPQWRNAAEKTLELDPAIPEAHLRMAELHFNVDWDWDGAEREAKLAIEMDPANVDAHGSYALLLSATGRHRDALAESKKAQQLDPLSVLHLTRGGFISLFAGDNDRANEIGRRAIAMAPDFFHARHLLGAALFRKGQVHEGIIEAEKAVQLSGGPLTLGFLGSMYGRAGQNDKAQKVLNQLLTLAGKKYVPADSIARVYSGLRDFDQANYWMNKAIQDREGGLVFFKVSADENTISNPYYKTWIKKIGL